MRISKRIAYVLLLLVTLVVFDVALSLALIPYGSKSEIVWHEYHAQEKLDTVVVGNSLALTGVDPFILDEELGVNSIDIVSPSQSCEEAYVALKEILSQRDVKTVYYCTEFVTFKGKSEAGPHSSFLFEKWRYDNPATIIDDIQTVTRLRSWVNDSDSINWLFPWIKNHVPYDLGKIAGNVKMRLDGTSLEAAGQANEEGWNYKGKGFGSHNVVADFNKSHKHYSSLLGSTKQASADKLKVLTDICSLCEEKGVKLVVVIMPMPTYCLYGIEANYESFGASIKDCVTKCGGEYYDFNLAKPGLFDNRDDLFRDYQHLNETGAETLTRALSRLLLEKEAGANVGDLFYSFKERLDATDTVQRVDINVSVGNGTAKLKAAPSAKKGLNAEYRFVYQREGDEGWMELRDYAPEATCTFVSEERGAYTFKVYARTAGVTEGEYDCYYQQTVVI